jgi:hypothetical protein
MKILLGLLFLAIVLGSLYADFRWKRWIARQQQAREQDPDNFGGRR